MAVSSAGYAVQFRMDYTCVDIARNALLVRLADKMVLDSACGMGGHYLGKNEPFKYPEPLEQRKRSG